MSFWNRYPLPEFANELSKAELDRRNPFVAVTRKPVLLSFGALIVSTTYFPWIWIADWTIIELMVAIATKISPIIEHAAVALQYMPEDAIAAQLSFLTLVCLSALVYRLATLPIPVLRQAPVPINIATMIVWLFLSLHAAVFLFYLGRSSPPDDGISGASALVVVSGFCLIWLAFGVACSFVLGNIKDLFRRAKNAINSLYE